MCEEEKRLQSRWQEGEGRREGGKGEGRGQRGEKVGLYVNVFGECRERKEDNITSWIP